MVRACAGTQAMVAAYSTEPIRHLLPGSSFQDWLSLKRPPAPVCCMGIVLKQTRSAILPSPGLLHGFCLTAETLGRRPRRESEA